MGTQGGNTMLAQGRDGLNKTAYERHQPEQTLLYQLVEAHYPALVDQLAQQGKSLPDSAEALDFLESLIGVDLPEEVFRNQAESSSMIVNGISSRTAEASRASKMLTTIHDSINYESSDSCSKSIGRMKQLCKYWNVA